MTAVSVVPLPPSDGTRLAFVLAEDRLGHYAEFREFFVRSFDLGRIGLTRAGCVRVASGAHYALIFIGRSGEPVPSGVEIHAIVPALEPLDDVAVDRDLWCILRWLIDGVGASWSIEALEATGRLFRVQAAANQS